MAKTWQLTKGKYDHKINLKKGVNMAGTWSQQTSIFKWEHPRATTQKRSEGKRRNCAGMAETLGSAF